MYQRLGEYIRRCYTTAVAATNGSAPIAAGQSIVLTLPAPALIDRVIIRERLEAGQRIRNFTVESSPSAPPSPRWQPYTGQPAAAAGEVENGHGTSVGNKRIMLLQPRVVAAVRLTVTALIDRGHPAFVQSFAAFAPCNVSSEVEPPPPPPSPTTRSPHTAALKCSLNGRLNSSNACECRTPWIGATCDKLDLLPVNRSAHPGAAAYGWSPNVSSWGGSVLRGDDGFFHLFVSEIQGGMFYWGNESKCVHATSEHQEGPFTRSDVALTNECHGAVVLRDPNDGEWLLFHQGNGTVQPKHHHDHSGKGFMHHSPSPSGPWTPAKTAPPGGCGMPTATRAGPTRVAPSPS